MAPNGIPFPVENLIVRFEYDGPDTDPYVHLSDNLSDIVTLTEQSEKPEIERVVSNGPATIVFWDDGEKTVVKCRECAHGKCYRDGSTTGTIGCILWGGRFDPEKAIMAAMLKRFNPGFQNQMRKALPHE